MMPWAGLLLSHVPPSILPDGWEGRADYNRLRRAAALSPSSPAALDSSRCIFMQYHNM